MTGFFAGKTVLVTGHTGFKGSWLAHWLKRLGARVVGFSKPPETTPSLFELAHVAEGMTSIEGDIRDLDALARVVTEHKPEIALHLAAQALVRRSYRDPVESFGTNVMGTVNLLEACRRESRVRAIVVVTSDKCYENREWLWGYREDEPLGGHDPYSASKAAAEIVTAAYRRSFFSGPASARVASARAGNVIGGGDWAEDRLVPDIVRGASRGAPIVIRNPLSTRPWQHVLDPLGGYLLLARRLYEVPDAYAEAWNFGPGDEAPVPAGELARRLVAILGTGTLEIATPDPTAVHEASFLKLDCSKAHARLGWRPRIGIDRALEMTARFYRAHLQDPSLARAMMDLQIGELEAEGA